MKGEGKGREGRGRKGRGGMPIQLGTLDGRGRKGEWQGGELELGRSGTSFFHFKRSEVCRLGKFQLASRSLNKTDVESILHTIVSAQRDNHRPAADSTNTHETAASTTR